MHQNGWMRVGRGQPPACPQPMAGRPWQQGRQSFRACSIACTYPRSSRGQTQRARSASPWLPPCARQKRRCLRRLVLANECMHCQCSAIRTWARTPASCSAFCLQVPFCLLLLLSAGLARATPGSHKVGILSPQFAFITVACRKGAMAQGSGFCSCSCVMMPRAVNNSKNKSQHQMISRKFNLSELLWHTTSRAPRLQQPSACIDCRHADQQLLVPWALSRGPNILSRHK